MIGRAGFPRAGAATIALMLFIWTYTFHTSISTVPTTVTSNHSPNKNKQNEAEVQTSSPGEGMGAASTNDRIASTKVQFSPPIETESKTFEKTVIMGKIKTEDGEWPQKELSDWRPVVYSMDDPEAEGYFPVSANKGREAMAYLTYLINFYDNLTDINVFIHAHNGSYPKAWHNEPQSAKYSAVQMLQLLRLDNIRENGYVNLRCNTNPGCITKLRPNQNTFKENAIEPGWQKLWKHMNEDKPLPEEVAVACCAQFAVSKEKIRERPKAYYEKLREWVLTTDCSDPGRVFEYFWHIMFGMPMVHCEEAWKYQKCICRTYDCGNAKRSPVDIFGGGF
ncbi:hypothetical protein TWF694_003615 [Orbilia ellipsospora]|uniref:Uncharacterized protein n=1 Tax=Orbilia ellipsospora TaxID=2528407 RepID=A0AAV9WYM3_9PEZI